MSIPYFLFLISYFLFFAFIAWRRFHLALALLFFLLPTYLIRFRLGPLPTTMLEIMSWIIIITWVIKETGNCPPDSLRDSKRAGKLETGTKKSLISNFPARLASRLKAGGQFLISKNLSLSIAVALFLLAATISIFTSIDIRAAAGEWKAFYTEPFLLFLVLISTISRQQSTIHNDNKVNCQLSIVNCLLFALVLSGLATSLLAVYQHFTGWQVPSAFWENGNSYRVTAWYGFPNGVGLYLAPLYPLAIYQIMKGWSVLTKRNRKSEIENQDQCLPFISSFLHFFISLFFLISAPLAILFSKSTGALIGLAAGLMLLLLMWKKTRRWSIGLGIVGLISLIAMPTASPLKEELLLQNRSGQIRRAIWSETFQLLRDRPILGAGLASYQERVRPHHTTVKSEGIEIFHHPHNIFLTMYINLGLLGLIGFVWILVWFYRTGFSAIRQFNNVSLFSYFLISSMTIIIVHGLVDSPYIKNDLAILFWLLLALLVTNLEITTSRHNRQTF